MSEQPSIATAKSGRSAVFSRRVALAPLCLCLVAGLHVYRVATAGQTPWKGGGFGMFSTVDAESSRYLRCFLVLDDGRELPLIVPTGFEKRAAELRAAPSADAAGRLVMKLARCDWTQPTAERIAEARAILAATPGTLLTAQQLDALQREQEPAVVELPGGVLDAVEAFNRQAIEQRGIAFTSVRVEVWKSGFDDTGMKLVGRPLMAATQPRIDVREAQP